jgi:hypothetical protein
LAYNQISSFAFIAINAIVVNRVLVGRDGERRRQQCSTSNDGGNHWERNVCKGRTGHIKIKYGIITAPFQHFVLDS